MTGGCNVPSFESNYARAGAEAYKSIHPPLQGLRQSYVAGHETGLVLPQLEQSPSDYLRAWEIVELEGYQKFLDDLNLVNSR